VTPVVAGLATGPFGRIDSSRAINDGIDLAGSITAVRRPDFLDDRTGVRSRTVEKADPMAAPGGGPDSILRDAP
jgi:hypothetical protein